MSRRDDEVSTMMQLRAAVSHVVVAIGANTHEAAFRLNVFQRAHPACGRRMIRIT